MPKMMKSITTLLPPPAPSDGVSNAPASTPKQLYTSMQVAELLEMATVRSFKSEALTGVARLTNVGRSVEERMTIARLMAFTNTSIGDDLTRTVIIITDSEIFKRKGVQHACQEGAGPYHQFLVYTVAHKFSFFPDLVPAPLVSFYR